LTLIRQREMEADEGARAHLSLRQRCPLPSAAGSKRHRQADTDRQTGRQAEMDGQTAHMHIETNRQTGRQADRQTAREKRRSDAFGEDWGRCAVEPLRICFRDS
jgi:hypothetical protein